MREKRRFVILLLGLALVVLPAIAQDQLKTDQAQPDQAKIDTATQKKGREYTTLFYDEQLETLHGFFTDDMKSSMTLAELTEIRKGLKAKLGAETELLGETTTAQDDYVVYTRRAKFEKFDGVIEVRWALRADHSIGALFVSEAR